MKLSNKIVIFITVLSLVTYQSYSQADGTPDYEEYSRAHMALTNFKMLGINKNQFAKCVESVNYLDPSKRHRLTIIEGVQFADDGKNFDLIANDGIMTSVQLSDYTKESVVLPTGIYLPVMNNTIVYDSHFLHVDQISGKSQQPEGFSISCKLNWVKCSAWPIPYRQFCRDFSWPFNGGFEIVECTLKFEE
ncbi:MAG: hypothetical protein IPP43_04860 [Chitinophagaceae bacterium]|nr:hypothetical protein [Chitinophagaceae bacterium]MBL0130516.1 hypothetical protein [Chitinophagaceae bacterium]